MFLCSKCTAQEEYKKQAQSGYSHIIDVYLKLYVLYVTVNPEKLFSCFLNLRGVQFSRLTIPSPYVIYGVEDFRVFNFWRFGVTANSKFPDLRCTIVTRGAKRKGTVIVLNRMYVSSTVISKSKRFPI